MKTFLGIVSAALLLGLLVTCHAGGNPEDALSAPDTVAPPAAAEKMEEKTDPFTGQADWIYEASDWVLNLYIDQSDGNNRGSHGILLFEGRQISGNPGEIRALPIGTVQYYGPDTDQGENSGWQMKDPLVKPRVNNSPAPDKPTSGSTVQ